MYGSTMGQERERNPSVKESASAEAPATLTPVSTVLVLPPPQPIAQPNSFLRMVFGVVLVFLVTICWTGATQFSKTAYSDPTNFNSPFFLVYFGTSWMSVCFPLYLLCQAIGYGLRLITKEAVAQNIKTAKLVFGERKVTILGLLARTAFFILFWFIANYAYSRALSYISPSDVTAIFSSNLAFVYLLSLCILKDDLYVIKVISILLSIAGIVLMAYQEGFTGVGIIGVVLVVLSSLAAAIYKVVFKRVIGDASFGQVSLFMTAIGVLNLFSVWPIMLGLTLSGTEKVVWASIPWGIICAQAALGLAFNFLVNLGLAVTNPLFISVGLFLGYPLNALVDVIFRHKVMGRWEICGSVLIVVGFLFMLLPDRTGRWMGKRLCPCVATSSCCTDTEMGDTSSQSTMIEKEASTVTL